MEPDSQREDAEKQEASPSAQQRESAEQAYRNQIVGSLQRFYKHIKSRDQKQDAKERRDWKVEKFRFRRERKKIWIDVSAVIIAVAAGLLLFIQDVLLWQSIREARVAAGIVHRDNQIALNQAKTAAQQQAELAQAANRTSSQALRAVQRAFVYVDGYTVDKTSDGGAVIMTRWKNSGTTPTATMARWVNYKWFVGEPPANYGFPDLDKAGNPTKGETVAPPMFMAPNSLSYSEPFTLTKETVTAVQGNAIILLVYGRARYTDVFGADHITRFSVRLALPKEGPALFLQYGRHNCTDETCKALHLE